MSIGVHTVAAYLTDPGAAVDITCLIDDVSLVYGRADTTDQPNPGAATINLTMSPTDPLPPVVDIGTWVTVDTTIAGTAHRRFTGRVTDMDIGWDDNGEATPVSGVGRLVAVSPMADYARAVIGSVPYPVESDGARVARVFAEAGYTIPDTTTGTVNVTARDIDAKAALEVAQGTASSAGGLVWEETDGTIRYADSDYRRAAQPSLVLDACDILVTPTWVRTISGLVNEITMQYGTAPDGGEQPVWYVDNPSSIERWGRYGYSVTTELADTLDASILSGLILAQNGTPVWLLAALPVDVKSLSDADTATLLEMGVHALVQLTGLPVTGPTPTDTYLWVEGWTERLANGEHEVELTVSDYCRTAPGPRWDDLDPATPTWDTVTGTWDSWSCWGAPVPDEGRWRDVPSSVRWADVPADIDWDDTAGTFPPTDDEGA